MNGERPTGYEWAKVFKAHVVPQGLCENLVNALKLLANQQTDGDSQAFAKEAKQKIMEGLRNFVKVYNHCALKAGHLKGGTRSSEL